MSTSSSAKKFLTTKPLRLVGAISAAVVAIVASITLMVGIDSRSLRLMTLLLASAAIAVVVVLIPATWRTRSALLVTAFLAAAGLLPTLTNDSRVEKVRVNVEYLAHLIRKGPFTEALPRDLTADGLVDVNIGDASAARRLDAVRLMMKTLPGVNVSPYGHMETYRSPEEAANRARAMQRYYSILYAGEDRLRGAPESFCVDAEGKDTIGVDIVDISIVGGGTVGGGTVGGWICGGYRGFVYAESAVSPADNATAAVAVGIVSAELRYTDRVTALASM